MRLQSSCAGAVWNIKPLGITFRLDPFPLLSALNRDGGGLLEYLAETGVSTIQVCPQFCQKTLAEHKDKVFVRNARLQNCSEWST